MHYTKHGKHYLIPMEPRLKPVLTTYLRHLAWGSMTLQ